MAPSVMLDTTSNLNNSPSLQSKSTAAPRTLLLSPPSLSSHPEKLNNVLEAHDRNVTDIQMLDRLSLNLVSLPDSTYDTILILSDADDTRSESQKLLSRDIFASLVRALKPNGILRSQDGAFTSSADTSEHREAILAGLVASDKGFVKPAYSSSEAVPLRLGKKKTEGEVASITVPAGTRVVSLNLNGKRANGPAVTNGAPSGVGFVDFSDDLDAPIEENSDDELIDEDTLLDEEDRSRPINQPPECRPRPGKRRRACKDCTCGLAQTLAAEDAAKRAAADQTLAKLKADDLAELDFTVQGKVGSCGNCALGDAFRCDGCPYVGLPAFKVGEEVRLDNWMK
ncbi:MAG: electron carrier [Icmadophila ericetorum]|nr:electron carrier [Icmadophila ericetorum]